MRVVRMIKYLFEKPCSLRLLRDVSEGGPGQMWTGHTKRPERPNFNLPYRIMHGPLNFFPAPLWPPNLAHVKTDSAAMVQTYKHGGDVVWEGSGHDGEACRGVR